MKNRTAIIILGTSIILGSIVLFSLALGDFVMPKSVEYERKVHTKQGETLGYVKIIEGHTYFLSSMRGGYFSPVHMESCTNSIHLTIESKGAK